MLYNSQNILNIVTLFSIEKYHILYRFSNGYGASVIQKINSNDVEVSVLTFTSDDILDYVVTTDTSISTEALANLKADDFINTMNQIENLI